MMGKSVSCFMAFAKSTMSFLTVVMSAVLLSPLFHTAPAVAGGFPAHNFTAPRAFDAGGNCFSVAVGDFNGDGASDLAVADVDSDKVSISVVKGRWHVPTRRKLRRGNGACFRCGGRFQRRRQARSGCGQR